MYQRILVPVDGSPTSIGGLEEAIKLAKLTGAGIRLVHVLDRPVVMAGETYTVDIFGIMKEAGEHILQKMKDRVVAAGVAVSTYCSEIMPGRVCDVVTEQAKDFDADLVVVGTHGRRGVGRLLVGSDAEQIARIAAVPVLLVRSTAASDAGAVVAKAAVAT